MACVHIMSKQFDCMHCWLFQQNMEPTLRNPSCNIKTTSASKVEQQAEQQRASVAAKWSYHFWAQCEGVHLLFRLGALLTLPCWCTRPLLRELHHYLGFVIFTHEVSKNLASVQLFACPPHGCVLWVHHFLTLSSPF